jgi:hypothetical protein
LRATREALHRNEVFAAGNVKVHSHEWNLDGPGADRRIHAAQADQKIEAA